MRITTGKYKNRNLLFAKSDTLRPTSDKVRKAVFDIIGDKIQGASFLDLFAGTGAVGIEAASRGAGAVDFVDVAFESVRIIHRNLEMLGIDLSQNADKSEVSIGVYRYSADRFLRFARLKKFDFIFLDPPYTTEPTICLRAIEKYDNLARRGWVVFEHARPITLEPFWKLVGEHSYGGKSISVLEHAT